MLVDDGAGLEHDNGGDSFGPARIRKTDDGIFQTLGACIENLLQFAREDVEAATLDHVLAPVDDVAEAVRFEPAPISPVISYLPVNARRVSSGWPRYPAVI